MGIEDLTPQQQKWMRYGEMVLESPDQEVVDAAKRLARKVKPDLHLPEVDLADKIEEERKARKDWEAEQEGKRKESDLQRRRDVEAQRSRDAGFDPDEIEKIVIEEKCSFPTALKLAALQRETAVPGPASWTSGLPLNKTRDGDFDWRKASPSERTRHSLDVAHQGIDDMIRRARGGR